MRFPIGFGIVRRDHCWFRWTLYNGNVQRSTLPRLEIVDLLLPDCSPLRLGNERKLWDRSKSTLVQRHWRFMLKVLGRESTLNVYAEVPHRKYPIQSTTLKPWDPRWNPRSGLSYNPADQTVDLENLSSPKHLSISIFGLFLIHRSNCRGAAWLGRSSWNRISERI